MMSGMRLISSFIGSQEKQLVVRVNSNVFRQGL